MSFVEVDVVGAQGILVPQAESTIDFTIDGPGTLAGVDNGNSVSHESYKGHSRSAFSGKALAIVQSSKIPGTTTLTATSGSGTGALKAGAVTILTAAP